MTIGRRGPDRTRRDHGSVMLIALVMVAVCGVLVVGTLTYVSTVLRSQPAVEDRAVAVESATSAMRTAILMQVAQGSEQCLDQATLPAGTFDSNDYGTAVTCTVLEAIDSSMNRYAVITTQTDPSRRALSGWTGTSGTPTVKDVDGDVLLNGGWLTQQTQDILVTGTSANRFRVEYSNSTASAPGVSPAVTPTVNRYRVDDTVLDCDGAALASTGYPFGASAIDGQTYGHLTPRCTTSTEAPLSQQVPWWDRAGDDLDPEDTDFDWHYPRLPNLPAYDRDGKYVDLTPTCRMYYPGRYDSALTVTGGREHYFASGVYHFNQPVTFTGGARVVFGAGRIAGCAVDSDLALHPSALTNHGITGKGATLLLDGAARITVNDAAVSINRRVSTPSTRGSEGVAIRTVNLGTSSANLQVPRDSVQVGEYPCVESSPGVCAAPTAVDPTNTATAVDVTAAEAVIPTKPTPTVIRYTGSTLAHTDNALFLDFRGSTNQSTNAFETDGHVFVPNAQVSLKTDSSGAGERLYSMLLNGGVVASRMILDARSLPLEPADNWYVGVRSSSSQLRVALKATAVSDAGRAAVSRSVLETRSDGIYAINSWTVDPDNSGLDVPVTSSLPPLTTPPTTSSTVAPSSTCPTISGWKAQFYNSPDLAGSVVLCRDEAAINASWGPDGPGSPVGVDGFSARYSRSITFAEGTYRFTIGADDGYRLIVDGEVVADCWCSDGAVTGEVDIPLAAGAHTVVLEYREITGSAAVSLTWGVAPPPTTTTIATTSTAPTTTIATTTTTISPSVCPTSFTGWKGEYFVGRTLSGTPAVCRDDADLQMNWDLGSPHAAIPTDNFSARWTRTESWTPGRYRLHTGSDDGIRVWIDGTLVYENWAEQPYADRTADVTVTGGTHTMVVEYFESGGYAEIGVWWEPLIASCPTASGTNWVGEYYASADLSGHRVVCREDATLDVTYGTGSPDPVVPSDYFSARWTRTATFVAGTHRFSTNSDDGVRLYVDGNLVMSDWTGGPPRDNWVDVPLSAGSHTIVLEYFEHTSTGNVPLSWRQVGCPTITGWRAEYYDNQDLSGDWVLCRDDASPNIDWGGSSPASNVPADWFSARWTRTETFSAGRYRFDLGADNGTRLYIDGVLVRDFWGPTSGYQTAYVEATLTAGAHTIVYEFREQMGSARAALSWALTPCSSITTGWRGEYYNNTTFTGSPGLCRSDAAVNFSWSGSPGSPIGSDNFSVRWTKDITVPATASYRFRVDIDSNYRLYIDGSLVKSGGTSIGTADVTLTAGTHLVQLEFWDGSGTARARLSWTPAARYVRVQLAGSNNLHLAEVRVLGRNTSGTSGQRAVGQSASQSSTYSSAAASRAVDNNTNGDFWSKSVSHTNWSASPWWQVDLASTFGVESVELWNRTDCCGDRLVNYTVFVSATDMSSQTYAQLLADPAVFKVTTATAPNPNTLHSFTWTS